MRMTALQDKSFDTLYYYCQHESGLRIYVYPFKGFRSTYAVIGTKFGSVNASFIHNGQNVTVPDGTAHYLEHKLFESEEGDAFTQYARTGAAANAYTSFDTTCYLFSCTERFDESLGILFDLIQSPYFTPETVAKEQGIIGQEIKMYDDSPDWRVTMNLLQAMYQNHPINKDIAGTVETIAEITPELLYECYNSYYNLHNMVLCVAGKVNPEEVLAIADQKLKPNEPVQTESLFPEEPYEVGQTYIEQALPVSMPMMALGFKEQAGKEYASDKDLVCTSMLLEAFAGSASPLYRELLDSKLINSTFGTEYMEGLGYRAVIFEGETTDPEKLAEVLKEAVRRLHKDGISEEAFDNARRCLYGRMARSRDIPSSVATNMINGAFLGRDPFAASVMLQTVTAADVNERLKQQLDPDNCTLSVIKEIEGLIET